MAAQLLRLQGALGGGSGTDLIRKAILTSADIGESVAADALICGDEAAVLADKAYESMERRETLAEIGITDRIMHRRQAGERQPSPPPAPAGVSSRDRIERLLTLDGRNG